MIADRRLGNRGRFGNQLFQYAFLRVTAQRLQVPFYCPPWVGDEIFQLDDGRERVPEPGLLPRNYAEPKDGIGFHACALSIEDGTEISGLFQSARYYPDNDLVRHWYTFREEVVAPVKARYSHIDFDNSVSVHLRFTDLRTNPAHYIRYYVPTRAYYYRAVKQLGRDNVLIFSDDPPMARRYLSNFKHFRGNATLVEGNEYYEDLYLMSLCRDNVCSVSTFSWWGAFLNRHPDRTVIVPREGQFRPGHPKQQFEHYCDDWVRIKAFHRRGYNEYPFLAMMLSLLRLCPPSLKSRARDIGAQLYL